MSMRITPRTLAALAAIGVAVPLAAPVFAAETAKTMLPRSDRHAALIQELATRFNLNKDDVQAFFDQKHAAQRTEMEAKMKERVEDQLTKAVAAGRITEVQKAAILAKAAELRTKAEEAMKTTDETQRKAKLDALRAETEQWLKDQGLDKRQVPFLLMGGHPGMGHPGGRGMMKGGMFKGRMAPPTDASTGAR